MRSWIPRSLSVPGVFGGTSNAAFRRAATHGDGWIMGGGDATAFQERAHTGHGMGERRATGSAHRRMRDFAAAACGELVFIPCNSDPAQVRLLAEALA